MTQVDAGPVPGTPDRAAWRMTEAQLFDQVVDLTEARGVRWVHVSNVHHSPRRGNLRGFPDLFLCGRYGVMFRELKTMRGAGRGVEGQQVRWKYALRAAGQDWAIWSPADLSSGRIARELDYLAGNEDAPRP